MVAGATGRAPPKRASFRQLQGRKGYHRNAPPGRKMRPWAPAEPPKPTPRTLQVVDSLA
jgi:hypothetical protein